MYARSTHPISSRFGAWLKGWQVRVDDAASPLSEAQIQEANNRRWVSTLGIKALFGVVFPLLVMPCHYLVIPVCRAILQHKTEAVMISLLAMVFSTLPFLLSSPIGIFIISAASLYLAYKLIEPIRKALGKKDPIETLECHKPDAIELQESINDLERNINTQNP